MEGVETLPPEEVKKRKLTGLGGKILRVNRADGQIDITRVPTRSLQELAFSPSSHDDDIEPSREDH